LVRKEARRKFFRSTKYAVGDNLSSLQSSALQRLRGNLGLKILPADKGGMVVVLDAEEYRVKMLNLLSDINTYERVELSSVNTAFENLLHEVSGIRGELPDKIWDWISEPFKSPRVGNMYGIPKIHKLNVPLRPILPGNGTPTERLAMLAEYCLKEIPMGAQSYVKDSFDFVEKLKHLKLQEHDLLCSVDVINMYPSIDISTGVQHNLDAYEGFVGPRKILTSMGLQILLEGILNNNHASFEGALFKQICGTAMGNVIAPSFANITMMRFDTEFLSSLLLKPNLRFFDDIFFYLEAWG
jgi:hypothetical protein